MKRILNEAADRVWYWFDEYRGGDYDNDWEKVGAFSDFIDEQEDEDLIDLAQIDTTHNYVGAALRKVINRGIDDWYGDPVANIKQALSIN